MITFKEWLSKKNFSEMADPTTFNKELAGVVNAANNPIQKTSQVVQDPNTMARTIYNNANPQLKKAFQDEIMRNMAAATKNPVKNTNTMPTTTTGQAMPTSPTVGMT